MLRCVGTPSVCTHNAFHTPRPFVHPIKISISLCKKRTSVNFEHIFFESSSYDDICHMPHNSSRICLKKSYSWDMGYWYFTPEKNPSPLPHAMILFIFQLGTVHNWRQPLKGVNKKLTYCLKRPFSLYKMVDKGVERGGGG